MIRVPIYDRCRTPGQTNQGPSERPKNKRVLQRPDWNNLLREFMSIIVHKFGGTSVGTPDRIRSIVGLVHADARFRRRLVVVSAFSGVTDQLIEAIDAALARSGAHSSVVDILRRRHQETLVQLVEPAERPRVEEQLDTVWRELSELLDGIYLLREATARGRDAVIGLGERASAPVVAAVFRAQGIDAVALDARHLIRTDSAFGEANVDFAATADLTRSVISEIPESTVAVVTGFVGSNEHGVQTTLGRSGSDYSATILAGAVDADEVIIWTDVDGVLSADPRLVRSAFTLPELSYREAAELAYFGAKVLHPRTMAPLQRHGIPVWIRNTMRPDAAGTVIRPETSASDLRVKAVTSVKDIALVMIEGTGMIGVPGIAARAFGSLAAEGVNVLLISQASSEQSICIGVRLADCGRAVGALNRAFELEQVRGAVTGIRAIEDAAVVSLVGDRMRLQPGIAGRMFSTLGYANINVLAIAQGAAETNISAVVSSQDVRRAVRSLHDAFARSHARAHLVLVGTGVVGGTFLDLLSRTRAALMERRHLELRLVGLARSGFAAWDPEGLPEETRASLLESAGEPCDLDQLIDRATACHLERLILIDATASEVVARRYAELLERGIAVVTPNKRANTMEQAYYDLLQRTAARRGVPFLYETTVGAALPIIGVLSDLVRSGDRIRRIEGVLSGTLAFVFNELAAGVRFSVAVREARRLGYTEPDPRDDLGGEDVARKLLTLAREAGWSFERSDMEVESLVPPELRTVSVEAFLEGLEAHDEEWAERARSGRLQFVATGEPDVLRVGVRTFEADHAFARLGGTDNMVLFLTDRYPTHPMIVQGAGAGPEVTAGGIMADVVRAAEAMR